MPASPDGGGSPPNTGRRRIHPPAALCVDDRAKMRPESAIRTPTGQAKTPMQGLRTITHFTRILVALFLVAQLAGVASSPLASAHAAASHVDHPHAHGQGHGEAGHHHGDRSGDRADSCCALHAFFAGVLPPAITLETADITGVQPVAALNDAVAGVDPGRLDRPPRPLP
jgi:hypothetical protein